MDLLSRQGYGDFRFTPGFFLENGIRVVGANAECAIDYSWLGLMLRKYYLNHRVERNLTAIVSNLTHIYQDYFPLVHPSPLKYWLA